MKSRYAAVPDVGNKAVGGRLRLARRDGRARIEERRDEVGARGRIENGDNVAPFENLQHIPEVRRDAGMYQLHFGLLPARNAAIVVKRDSIPNEAGSRVVYCVAFQQRPCDVGAVNLKATIGAHIPRAQTSIVDD